MKEREPGLSAAILRVGASLDVDTVLGEVVESACELTGARYGVIALVDDAGLPADFVTSGFTPEEQEQLMALPDAHGFFEHLHDLAAPLRLPDLSAYVRSLGLAPFPIACGAYQATPMRHRGAWTGSFFLGGKDGGFTERDEEVLVVFAAQAATAIANARAHRDERTARARLETLIETAPVGVVVFDAARGAPVSLNLEAKRLVAGLAVTDRSATELLEALTCRRSDGREVALAELTRAETLRGEEIEITLPDGRSVCTLVNATPIRSAGGEVETVVVTMQDLGPFEELDRSRAEFLGMVSGELRAPLTSIKGSAATVRDSPRVFDQDELRQFFRIVEEQADRMDGLLGDLLDAGRIGAGALPVDPAPAAVADLVERAQAEFAARGGAQEIAVDLPPDLPRVLADGERIVQVLTNLLVNAARHAPGPSPIRVAAARDDAHVAVSVADNGEGVAPERLPHLFRRYGNRQGAGMGLGLVICKGLVEAHGGRIRAESAGPGRGLRVTFTLPADEDVDATGAAGAAEPERGTTVLAVIDDPRMLRYVRDALAGAGYAPVLTGDPQDAARLVEAKRPSLVLLDLVPPGGVVALMERIPALARVPVILFSAYGRDETVTRALEAGAADYVVKPFSPTELAARVRAALRRRYGPEPFRTGDLAIDYRRRAVTLAGRPVTLSVNEYELLRALALDAGGVSTYESLLSRVWGETFDGDAGPVRGLVKRLRRKLGDDADEPRYVLNARGVGYRIAEPDGR